MRVIAALRRGTIYKQHHPFMGHIGISAIQGGYPYNHQVPGALL
jgi:hypothetical protein